MKVLITGGAGYIGSHVNKYLNKLGIETVVIDNLVNGHIEFVKWGKFYKLDLSNKEAVYEVLKKEKIKAVMHFAAFAYVGESVNEPAKYYLNNVYNTLNLLEVMLKNNIDIIVFSSTCAVYGNPKYIPIDENHPKAPISPYGKSKLSVEMVLEDFSQAYGIRYASLRYFNAAGADKEAEIGEWHEPETHLIPNILDVAFGVKEYVEIFGTDYETEDGTCIRDFIHVEDLAKAHILALEYIMKKNENLVLNLGVGRGYSVKQVIKVVEEVTGKKIKVKESPRRKGDPPVLVADPSRAKELLGWKPENGIYDIVESAWIWHKKLRTNFS